MSKHIPVMPGINPKIQSPSEEDKTFDSEEITSEEVNSDEQVYITPDSDVASNVSVPKTPRKGILVVATRKGFYGQRRLVEGDKFTVQKSDHLATWMKCVDPDDERTRIENLRKKKAIK